MKNAKIGTIFVISVLALAGIGISYAGLTDTIFIYGTVITGTVDLEIEDYSGTWVWKVYPHGIDITNDPTVTYEEDEGELVAYAKGRPVQNTDPPGYDAVMQFHNLFPCIDFMADIVFHYQGSIPAKITNLGWDFSGDLIDTDNDGQPDTDFIEVLMDMADDTGGEFGLTYEFYKYNDDTSEFDIPISVGDQLHFCDLIKLIVTIHLPQSNLYQNLAGTGYVIIDVLQWNDQCDEEEEFPDIEITKTVDNPEPVPGETITFTVTATNLGPGDATSVIVEDILPSELVYGSHVASKGTYDDTTGEWDIGSMNDGESETLDITVVVDVGQTVNDFTQFALVIDGSASIPSGDWIIMREGIADAIRNPECFPHDGMVELTVIQFGTDLYCAEVVVSPTIINDTNYEAVATIIENMPQGNGWTPMAAGLYLAANQLKDSINFDPANRQVINLVTDGIPNVCSDPDELCGTIQTTTAEGKICAIAARNYLLDLLEMTIEQDEFDAEAVGAGTDVTWLRDNIVWPQPGYDDWPPSGPGWVRYVDSYSEFASTICEKFTIIFQSPENTATLIECIPEDTNPNNNQATVSILIGSD